MQQAARREPASWPHQVGVIPHRAQSFQHRAEVEQLRAAIASGGTATMEVLTGTGGVGKTQLAADYARAAWESGRVDVLVWITVSTRSAALSGYAQAGIEVLGSDPRDPEQVAKTFLAWLEPKPDTKPCRWLIILDDVADPDDLRGLWPPASPYGRTLVTTRRRDAALTGEGRRLTKVGMFTEAEAVAYLATSLAVHGRHEPAAQLVALAVDLGCLPVALAQATAYLIDSGENVTAYRHLLADRTTTLSATSPDRLPDEQAIPLAAAWSLSVDRADTLRPAGLARPMLQLAALLDPNGIPEDVLTSEPALTYLAQHRSRTDPGQARRPKWWPGKRQRSPEPVTREEATGALRALHRISLIDHYPTTAHQAVRVHQLIQRAIRDALAAEELDQVARTAADALMAAWPYIEVGSELGQALRANSTTLTAYAEAALYRTDAHVVLYRAGRSLGDSGQVTAALSYFKRLVETTTHYLGSDHRGTLAARQNLAGWRGKIGDAAGAAAAYAELLEQTARVLGPDHRDTLSARHNLAAWRREMGDAAGATAAYAELLNDQVRILGPSHPDTVSTWHSLARSLGEMGDATGAAAIFSDLLEHMMRVPGPDDVDTLAVRGDLAHARGEAGDAAGAAAAYAELLDDEVRILGADHAYTLTTRNNLAYWREEAGDAAGAAAAYAELVNDQVRILGPDHPNTFTARSNFANSRGKAGDAAGAAAAYTDLLATRLRVLGPDHPGTLFVRSALARWRGEAGDVAGAAAAYAELLDDQVRILGPDHPNTLGSRFGLADWRERAGDAAGALAAFAELLEHQMRIAGPDDPDTLGVRHVLADSRGKAGDAAGAASAYAELLVHMMRVLGPNHTYTLTAQQKLAYWRDQTDSTGSAIDNDRS